MISIQTAMFVALGFLIASMLVVLLTPAYRARTVRLTAARVRASLPTTEGELRADKDRIRADNALRIHRLETQLDQYKFNAARQSVEVGRRDGQINALTSSLDTSHAEMEAALNARNVLEQTIADRLPKVEQRLMEAKKLLFQRDREIGNLTQDAERTQRALVEAVQINTQQRSEIERLNMVLETRAAQNRDGLADPTFDTEVAFRSEIEALRSRTRDQASVLERVQAATGGDLSSADLQRPNDDASVPEVVRLQRDLVRAETALKALRDVASAGYVDQGRYDHDIRQRDQKIEDQALEITRQVAALATYEAGTEAGGDRGLSIKDSKIAMKSKLSSLQVQTEAQTETIRKLRAEVAASNEKLARQAQHFMEEMRRLGAGTLPASAQPRRPASSAERRTLTQKISEAKPELANGGHAVSRPVLVKSEPVALPVAKLEPPANPSNSADAHDITNVAEAVSANVATVEAGARPSAAARPRLMDRITDYGKT